MPLFTYPPVPVMLVDPTALAAGGNVIPNAGAAFFEGYTLYAPVTVTQMRAAFSGSPTGNCDMGIYDSTGTNGAPNNLLGHTGAIAAVTGLFTQNLTANLLLSPGKYWIAFLDTIADTVQSRTTLVSGIGPYYRTTATNLTVLPATAGAVAVNGTSIAVAALLSGGFS
jgi:hypothetical protein